MLLYSYDLSYRRKCSMNKPTQQTSQESPKTVGIGFLIIIATGIVVGGIMHFSSDPVSSQPIAPVVTNSDRGGPARNHQSKPVASKPLASGFHSVLDKRYPISERRQLFVQLVQQQLDVQDTIHAEYERLPPPASPEENVQRTSEEGQKTVDAQGKVYDTIEKEYRLTDDEMADLIQEGRDNHWDKNAAPPL